MLRALEPAAAREMENLLYRQAYDQRRYRQLIESAEPEALERLHGDRAARGGYGTGGGRSRRLPVSSDS